MAAVPQLWGGGSAEAGSAVCNAAGSALVCRSGLTCWGPCAECCLALLLTLCPPTGAPVLGCAVNKPAGVITAPKHRYTGGSMVNRIIGERLRAEVQVSPMVGSLGCRTMHAVLLSASGRCWLLRGLSLTPSLALRPLSSL